MTGPLVQIQTSLTTMWCTVGGLEIARVVRLGTNPTVEVRNSEGAWTRMTLIDEAYAEAHLREIGELCAWLLVQVQS